MLLALALGIRCVRTSLLRSIAYVPRILTRVLTYEPT